uniref:Carboxypeptidase regulatory-like domain-containing protein n=1 Tax=candidate division WOR-3 bacterium TaxID=2052148 RepID=A0A7C4UCE3_UNCW3
MRKFQFILFLFLIGCPDAPHDNLYDLNNPSAKGGITGRVLTYAGRPVENVRITLNDTIISYSDEDGYYLLKNLKPGEYILKIEKKDYKTLFDTISIKSGFIDTIDYSVVSIPHFTYIKIYSRFTRWYDMNVLNEVLINAVVTDYDYIIDAQNILFIDNKDTINGRFISFADPDGFSGFYKGKFQKEDIHSFENDTIILYADDKKGTSSYKNFVLKNVIDTFTNIIKPLNGETLTFPYKFIWSRFGDYRYTILIWKRENGIDDPSVIYEGLGNLDTTITISNLSPGIYEWSPFIMNNNGNMGGKTGWFMIR